MLPHPVGNFTGFLPTVRVRHMFERSEIYGRRDKDDCKARMELTKCGGVIN